MESSTVSRVPLCFPGLWAAFTFPKFRAHSEPLHIGWSWGETAGLKPSQSLQTELFQCFQREEEPLAKPLDGFLVGQHTACGAPPGLEPHSRAWLSGGFFGKLLSSDPAGSTFLHDEEGIPVFTLNNVFLCLNPMGVKFFQISGSILQLQWDRHRFMAVGKGPRAGSVWAPLKSRISTSDGKTG